jgi:hypothetical protein
MKKILITIFVLSTILIGCTNLDINEDPDLLATNGAPMSAQLPAGISGIIGSEGASLAIIGGMWSQYWTQSNNASQYKTIDNYSIGTSDYNYIWDGMYDALGDIRSIKRRALAEENWNYYLIAATIDAQASQILTDMYGDISYTEANDITILTPKFNTGIEVYDLMISDLNFALSKNLADSKGEIPGKDDFIFAGNMANWTKLANTLKLKIYMRQTNSSRKAIADAGITELVNSGVPFLDVDAGMTQFSDAPDQSNPLYEYNNRQLNVATNLRMSTTLASLFAATADPRRDKYYGAGGSLNQGDINNPTGQASFAVVTINPTTPAYLMTKEESLLLQAEALERNGQSGKAKYDEAVNANFSKYYEAKDVAIIVPPFLATGGAYEYPASGTFEQKLEAIITQKWIASFPGNGFEAFFETNRTGYPVTSAVYQDNPDYIPGQIVYSKSGVTGGLFPKRMAYPLTERNANTNSPALVPITTKIWWN